MTAIFITILIMAGLFLVWLIFHVKKNSKVTLSPDRFQQGNLIIEYATGTMKIKNETYKVSQIRSIGKVRDEINKYHTTTFVRLELDDFKRPVYDIRFGNADDLAQRLKLAIVKAGGPDLHIHIYN